MNLDYYHNVFNGKPDKMRQVREAILKDFHDNERDLVSAAQSQNIPAMRKVLHKMTPIAETLQYDRLTQTILAFKEVNFEPIAVQKLIHEMHNQLIILYDFLENS